jgi:hypothetical protein
MGGILKRLPQAARRKAFGEKVQETRIKSLHAPIRVPCRGLPVGGRMKIDGFRDR